MAQTTSTAAFRYLGTADDITECEHCGRVELRSTVVLAVLDADGSEESIVHYGSTCAARALQVRGGGREVRRAGRAATIATLQAARSAYNSLQRWHSQHAVVVDGRVEFLRPRLLANAAAGIDTAVERVESIRHLGAWIADAALLGYTTREAVETKLYREGF